MTISSSPCRCALVAIVLAFSATLSRAKDLPADHALWPKKVFDWSYTLVASPQEMAALDTLQGEARERFLGVFWKRRDPTPTTPENEFKKQFEDRVDYALLHFRTYSRPEPWDRRGEVYVRFGPPDDIIDSTFEAYYEKWYYYNLNLKFMFRGGTEGHRIVPFREYTGEVQSLPRYHEDIRRMESKGVLYAPPPGEVAMDVALECYPFRRTDGSFDVYIACAAPLKALANLNWQRSIESLNYVVRIVAFDSALGLCWSDSVHVRETRMSSPSDGMSLHEWSVMLPPGLYVLAVELEDAQSAKRGVSSFDRWLVPYDTAVELDLSPLVVAMEVRPATATSGNFVRNDREIVPMPAHIFTDDQSVAFYHEVYNLRPDGAGICHYRVEYSLYPEGAAERRTLFVRDFESVQRETFQAGTIPATAISSGSYILEALTTDLVADVTRTALARFRVD